MDLEKTAGEVSTIAVDQTVIVPDGETNGIHYVETETATYEDIVTGILGHITKSAIIDVILDTGILQFCTGSQSKVEGGSGHDQELDVIAHRQMEIQIERDCKIGLVERSLTELERKLDISTGKVTYLDSGCKSHGTFDKGNLV